MRYPVRRKYPARSDSGEYRWDRPNQKRLVRMVKDLGTARCAELLGIAERSVEERFREAVRDLDPWPDPLRIALRAWMNRSK